MSFDFDGFRKKASEDNHSDAFIRQTIEYATHLDKQNLPVIFSTVHLAINMKMPSDVLTALINTYNYTFFNLKKKSGTGFREIMVPNEKLKYVQRWLNYNILQKRSLSTACTGFRPDYSILKNAVVHSDSLAIYKIDLLRFFDTITDRRVFGLFKSFGYIDNLAFDLSKLCTQRHKKSYWSFVDEQNYTELNDLRSSNPPVLPQGAPTSPAIANLIATKMDERFLELSRLMDFRYTRYADDLTFSIIEGGRFPNINLIKKIITEEGFFINPLKIKLYKRGVKQYVTGLTVTNGTHVSKKYRKEIYTHLYFCQKHGPNDHLKHLFDREQGGRIPYGFQDWLLGKISFVFSIDNKEGTKMFKEFEKINWPLDESG